MQYNAFIESLITYLQKERDYTREDIDRVHSLPEEEKERLGYLIRNAFVISSEANAYELRAEINETRFRSGDKVSVYDIEQKIRLSAIVIENTFDSITIQVSGQLVEGKLYYIEAIDPLFYEPIINLYKKSLTDSSGTFFINQLIGNSEPHLPDFGRIPAPIIDQFIEGLDISQETACRKALERPSTYCIIGPPGTGKTDVLASIACCLSSIGREVLILSNTHMAVNNALNKCVKKYKTQNAVKVGEKLKAVDLDDSVFMCGTFKQYLSNRTIRAKERRKRKEKGADIVGMTIQSAIINIGLRNTGFSPYMVLVDEAGQIPLCTGAALGFFEASSIILIGDDKQMPPIFHERLIGDTLSKPIFSMICQQFPQYKSVLNTSYRMNEQITKFVCSRFYKPDGIIINSADIVRNRKLTIESNNSNPLIRNIFRSDKSIIQTNVTTSDVWCDSNDEEAEFISQLVLEALQLGIKACELAVITPFRKQVKNILSRIREKIGSDDVPLVDTVERLQGQDVEMIVISFCTSSPEYFETNKDFLLNPNRFNVMVSRAKKKVVIFEPKCFNAYRDYHDNEE